MEKVLSWIFSALVVILIPYTVYFNILHIYSAVKWKCRKEKYIRPFKMCHNSDCKFSVYCDKYEHICTKEDIAELYKILDEYEKQA